jgi:hypothetical protein
MSLKVKLLGAIVGIVIFLIVSMLVRRKKINTIYAFSWFILSVALLVVVSVKGFPAIFAKFVGIHLAPLALIVVAIFGIFIVLFHLTIIVSSQNKQIKKLEKNLALLNVTENK